MTINNIAVIGAGVMGSDVALNLAAKGCHVILKDINDSILVKARERITSEFKMLKFMSSEFKDFPIDELHKNIQYTSSFSISKKVDLVIENIVEDWNSKKAVYKELCEYFNENTYYAVNTSCIPITKIAALLPQPERVIGMHFMNPVPLKPMVEVVRGLHTSSDTEDIICNFLKSIGKNPVVVNDYPGFVANRVSHLFMNEAAFLVQDNVASPEQVDIIFKQGYGHKMGPLETADLIGLDTVVNSLEVLYHEYQDPKFRCCPLLKKMVAGGLYGKKSGKGFFNYKSCK